MLAFKRVDCVVQGITILAGLVMALTAPDMLSEGFMGAYFLVGGWQLLSVIVHFFYKAPYETKMRKIYLVALLLVIVVLLLCLPSDAIISGLFALLVVSPFMAVFYLAACIKETNKLSLMLQPARGEEAGV
jgi:uncharacterized membrane protein YesL